MHVLNPIPVVARPLVIKTLQLLAVSCVLVELEPVRTLALAVVHIPHALADRAPPKLKRANYPLHTFPTVTFSL